MIRRPPRSTLFPYTSSSDLTKFCTSRGLPGPQPADKQLRVVIGATALRWEQHSEFTTYTWELPSNPPGGDRKSTRLNSSHGYISYAVFCLKKKKSSAELDAR